MPKLKLILVGICTAITLSACAPLIVGGAAVVVADAVVEEENGGDGLF